MEYAFLGPYVQRIALGTARLPSYYTPPIYDDSSIEIRPPPPPLSLPARIFPGSPVQGPYPCVDWYERRGSHEGGWGRGVSVDDEPANQHASLRRALLSIVECFHKRASLRRALLSIAERRHKRTRREFRKQHLLMDPPISDTIIVLPLDLPPSDKHRWAIILCRQRFSHGKDPMVLSKSEGTCAEKER